jgi:hypothetical protein
VPRFPIYIPSKGRARRDAYCTARFLTADGVPFRLVVERSEAAAYEALYPEAEVLVLPFSDAGSVIPARNWIREHAEAEGHTRHWQLDDNIFDVRRLYAGKRIPCNSGIGLWVCEEFSERYTNVGVSGLNYQMFVSDEERKPYFLNVHVYSCTLINHAMPYRWRGRYNEDTDLCLQALAGGWCTVALNVFMAHKRTTMKMAGGNTEALSYFDDGRLRMARALERQWPHVVETRRRFKRPQHVIRGNWRGFDTRLIRRTDIDWDALPAVDELGMECNAVRSIRSPIIERVHARAKAEGF